MYQPSGCNSYQFKSYQKLMKTKWKIFTLTFISYALIHAVRASWSSLKYSLNSPPFGFSPLFLGALDMFVLLILAVCLTTLGPKVVRQGPKKYLQKGLMGLAIILSLLGFLLLVKTTASFPYSFIYPFVGVLSCVGWPICMYILSFHFQKGIMFSIWSGCIQFGDFTSLLLSFLVVQKLQTNPGVLLFIVALLLGLVYLFNKKHLPDLDGGQMHHQPPEQSPAQQHIQDLVQEKQIQGPTLSNQKMGSISTALQKKGQTVNFLTVWRLPGVTGYILSFVFVKSVNAMISTWLVFYLSMIDMVSEAHIIALLWSLSTFGGGILGAYLNPHFNKKLFIGALFACAVFFVFLQQLHLYPNQIQVVVLIIACGIIFGGPFTVMNSSIPLYLSEKPQIAKYPGAKAAIISAMEGYPLLFCGISLIIVPAIGVIDLHWLASFYCVISATILLWQQLKQQKQMERVNKQINMRRGFSEPVIKSFRQKNIEWSLNLEQSRARRRRRSQRIVNTVQNEVKKKQDSMLKKQGQIGNEKKQINQVQQIIIEKLMSKEKSLLSDGSSEPNQHVVVSQQHPSIHFKNDQNKQINRQLQSEVRKEVKQQQPLQILEEKDLYEKMSENTNLQSIV